MKGMIWFRNDLRIEDNPALYAATSKAKDGVIGIYIMTPETWHRHKKSACQVMLILKHLKALRDALLTLNIPLWVREVNDFADVPVLFASLVKKHEIEAFFFNRQYEYDEAKRDQAVLATLKNLGCACYNFDDQTIVPPGALKTQNGLPFKVFTPFKKAWLLWVEQEKTYQTGPAAKPLKSLCAKPDPIPTQIKGFHNTVDIRAWPIGEAEVSKKLTSFCAHRLVDYAKARDYPALNATSQLSPYLAIGVLSPRQCVHAVLKALKAREIQAIYDHEGYECWLSELIWREFYRHILYFFPRVSMNQPFQRVTQRLKWRDDPSGFKDWCTGNTGIPLVDAAMRCLNQTGWMHNRLRMVTAMFLSKNLFLDWRLGEAYFMAHLLDGDLASNNGGWQWSASTGTDAVPYFRVFNPVLQSEKFDPQGTFIRQFCPELADLDHHTIHFPFERGIKAGVIEYPKPRVDLKRSRLYAIQQFKQLYSKEK